MPPFTFSQYTFDPASRTLTFHYTAGEHTFKELITFPAFPPLTPLREQLFHRAAHALFIMAGVSYWKAVLSPTLHLAASTLTAPAQDFFTTAYTLGLGQFFYQNHIDPTGKINFTDPPRAPTPTHTDPTLTGNLVALGGGKDSLLTTEILKAAHEPFDTFTVGHCAYPFFTDQIHRIGHTHHTVLRHISPHLLELNAAKAPNGHIPITAIVSLIGVCLAILLGKKNIILSNDQSTDEENIMWHGIPINHQYSKTLSFEHLLQQYITTEISPDIAYYSLLRPLSQLRIAELFSSCCLTQYAHAFSSCNANFKLQTDKNIPLSWCGHCPKCAFVYLIFAATTPRDQLLALFGHDLFTDPALLPTWRELLGVSGIKPFECVGEIHECRTSWRAIQHAGTYTLPAIDFPPPPHYDYATYGAHALPPAADTLLHTFLAAHPPCISIS